MWMGPAVIDELWWDLMGWHQVRTASSPTLLPQLDQLRRPHQHATATIRPRRLLSGLTLHGGLWRYTNIHGQILDEMIQWRF